MNVSMIADHLEVPSYQTITTYILEMMHDKFLTDIGRMKLADGVQAKAAALVMLCEDQGQELSYEGVIAALPLEQDEPKRFSEYLIDACDVVRMRIQTYIDDEPYQLADVTGLDVFVEDLYANILLSLFNGEEEPTEELQTITKNKLKELLVDVVNTAKLDADAED